MWIISLCVAQFLFGYVLGQFRTDYMTQTCNASISNTVGGRLESGKDLRYDNNMDCTFTVDGGADRQILALFGWFQLEPKLDGVCLDYLNVYDGADKTAALLNNEPLCGELMIDNYTSTGSFMTFHFVTDENAVYKGFDVIYSSFSYAPCDGSQFACSDGLCVDEELRCNDVLSCGDGSDEDDNMCTALESSDSGVDWGIVLGCGGAGLVILIVTCVLLYKYYDHRRWLKWLRENDLGRYPWEEEDDLYKYPVTYRYQQHPATSQGKNAVSPAPEVEVHNSYRPSSSISNVSSALWEANRPLSESSSIKKLVQ